MHVGAGQKEGLTVKMDACVKTKPPTSKGRINASARQSVRYRMQDRGIRSTLGWKGGRDRRARRVKLVWVGKLEHGVGIERHISPPGFVFKVAVFTPYSCRCIHRAALRALPYNAASAVRSVPCFPVCPPSRADPAPWHLPFGHRASLVPRTLISARRRLYGASSWGGE